MDFESLPWKPHPTVPGVTSRFQELEVPTHPALDAMVARLEAKEWVPWHVHDETCELAYVIEGEGRLHEAEAPPAGEATPPSNAQAPPGGGRAFGAGDATSPDAGSGSPATGGVPGAADAPGPGAGGVESAVPGDSGVTAHTLRPGTAVFIPVGTHHAVENVGASSLVIFAVHTSPREEDRNE